MLKSMAEFQSLFLSAEHHSHSCYLLRTVISTCLIVGCPFFRILTKENLGIGTVKRRGWREFATGARIDHWQKIHNFSPVFNLVIIAYSWVGHIDDFLIKFQSILRKNVDFYEWSILSQVANFRHQSQHSNISKLVQS